MKTPFFVLFALLMLGAGCADRAVADQEAIAEVPVEAAADTVLSDSLLVAIDRDSVLLLRGRTSARLEWRNPAQLWTSGPIHGGTPTVRLVDIDGDGQRDLFWSLEFEEFAGGMVLLSRRDSIVVAFQSGSQSCRAPILRDMNGDGLLDVEEVLVGVLKRDECRGDAAASMCQERFPTEWRQAWTQAKGGEFSSGAGAREHYRILAGEYRHAAAELRAAIARGDFASSSRCNVPMADGLDALARRAEAQP